MKNCVRNWIWRAPTLGVFKAKSVYELRLIQEMMSRAKREIPECECFKMQLIDNLRKNFISYGLVRLTTVREECAIGYALWNYYGQGNMSVKQASKWNEDVALRQIAIFPSFQRKGYGKKLLEICLKDLNVNHFTVESPDDAFLDFLIKHGYAHREATEKEIAIKGDRVSFFFEG